MANFIQKLLEIDKSEQTPVLLLLANSFCIGVFIVSYDVAASTIFLNRFGKDYLTYIPIATGVLGMISTSIFAVIQRRVLFTHLALVCFGIITLIAALVFYGLEFYNYDWIKLTAFLCLGPINAIFLLCFYGTVSRSFSLKREKHMTNTVDQGQMVATAISFFVVYFVSNYVSDVARFMVVSIGSGFLGFVFMGLFVHVHGDAALKLRKQAPKQSAAKVKFIVSNPYIRIICFLFLGSVIATIFLEFSFLNVTVQKYNNEADLARFLGVFGGAVTVLSFLLQTFVADWAIKTYGPRISLILIPIVLGFFAVSATLIGTFLGYTSTAPSFIFFFLFIAMSKMFLQSLKEAFEDPIVKTLFLPLESSVRYDIQIKVEGFFKEFSGFIAGALLTVIFLMKLDLIYYSYFLIAICTVYAFVVIKLFVEYRKTLTDTLTSHQAKEFEIEQKDYEITDVLVKEITSNDDNKIIFSLKLLEKIDPLLAENQFISLLENKNHNIKEYSLSRLEANKTLKSIAAIRKSIIEESKPEVKLLAEKALYELNKTDTVIFTHQQTFALSKSRNVADRIYAAQLISKTNDEVYLPQLLVLLRDTEPKVRVAAMVAASKVNKIETWPILIEYLSSYTFTNVAAAAIISYGEKILPTLEAAFYKTGQSETVQEKIVQIYGRIQGDTVIGLLWNKIDLPSKKIVNNVLMCLSSCGFRPKDSQVSRIKQAIEVEIGNSAWVIAALTEIPNAIGYDYLKSALDEEIQYNFENIYMLLSLIYDPQAIKLVKDNLESGTVEGVVYGIELLDVFVADDIKPIFFPLIEDISQTERNERLQGHFPRQRLDETEVLLQIINRDYNSINKWTKACALYVYGNIPEAPMCDDLTANLFNPDDLLREVAAWAIYAKNPISYQKNTLRLSESYKKELDFILLPKLETENHHNYLSRIQKILFLKSIDAFKNVSGVILVEFVELIEEVKFRKNSFILEQNSQGDIPIYVVYKGKATAWETNNVVHKEYNTGDMIGEMLVLETDNNLYNISVTEDTILLKIDKQKFYEQINDNFELAKELIRVVGNKLDPNRQYQMQDTDLVDLVQEKS